MRKLVVLGGLLCAIAAQAATPPEGVELKVRRGFFTETDIGAFFTLGGNQSYSNAQTYLQLGIGYDISENIELAANFGIGASAADCFVPGADPSQACPSPFSDNFTVAFIDLDVAYFIKLYDRLYLAPKVAGGYTSLDPAPLQGSSGNPITSAMNVGLGVGIEYATYMDHFSIGADLMVRLILGPNIPAIAIFPRVKYTF